MAHSQAARPSTSDPQKPLILASIGDDTAAGVTEAAALLASAGYEVRLYPADGQGGRELEAWIREGGVAGVLDLTTNELADELVGGIGSAGMDRLTAASLRGVPQVVSVGGLDRVTFGPSETIPECFHDRRFHPLQPDRLRSGMRTTPRENDQLGKELVQKASASSGPTAVLLPLRGVSRLDAEGEPFWWPEADDALFQSVRNWAYGFDLIELDLHINDRDFAKAAAAKLLEMMQNPHS